MTTPHINAEIGQFAETVLMPGDPLRAKHIAETFLTDVVQVTTVRNMFGYTGKYKGKTVSVMGSGMGVPSISIYATELVKFYGVKNIIFVGKSPEWTSSLPKIIMRKHLFEVPRRSFAHLDMASNQLDDSGKNYALESKAQFVSLRDYFCNTEGCLVYLGDDPRSGLTTLDGNHLSPIASEAIARDVIVPMITSGK
jgi:DeoD family purine-nucleoside phosphorylase